MPLALLEGMGFGLSVIATPVGAISDIIKNNENGLIISVGDVAALENALCRMITDKDLRNRLGCRARADFEASYDIKSYRAKLEDMYLRLLPNGNCANKY